MPRTVTTVAHVINHSLRLPPGHPIREACRMELWRIRERCKSAHEVAVELGVSVRHARRILAGHAVKRYTERQSPRVRAVERPGRPHPPQRWCSCEWCVAARGAA